MATVHAGPGLSQGIGPDSVTGLEGHAKECETYSVSNKEPTPLLELSSSCLLIHKHFPERRETALEASPPPPCLSYVQGK